MPGAGAEPIAAGCFTEARGRGLVVAVVDTGVNFDHPHLLLPSRGVAIAREDSELTVVRGAVRDQYGHGTCCAALLHLLAPDAELFAVRVTGDRATTDADRLARGIEAAAEEGAAIICVALGTTTRLRAGLDDAVARAGELGAVVVAADPYAGTGRDGLAFAGGSALPSRDPMTGARAELVLPAASPGAIGVGHRDGVDVALAGGEVVAEGRARPAPGFSHNFWGASLSTARAAAALARFAEGTKDRGPTLARGFKKALSVL